MMRSDSTPLHSTKTGWTHLLRRVADLRCGTLAALMPLFHVGCDDSTSTDGAGEDGGESSDESNSDAPPVVETIDITCTDHGKTQPQLPTCECQSAGGSGEPEVTGPGCKPDTAYEFCCADAAYPSSGACGCYVEKQWYCTAQDSGSCYCGFEDTEPWNAYSGECDNTPDAQGNPWFCCAWYGDNAADQCACYPGTGGPGACGAGEAVSDCASAGAAGFDEYPSSCAEGTVPVDICADGESSSDEGGGCDPSFCSGTVCDAGFCCVSYCSAGACEITCT